MLNDIDLLLAELDYEDSENDLTFFNDEEDFILAHGQLNPLYEASNVSHS